MYWESYYQPKTVEEALGLLEKNRGDARLIAGGTDLMLQIMKRKINAKALVDLGEVKELKYIVEDDGWIKIGALTTHKEIIASRLLQEKVRVLVEAAQNIGSPQIRNIGTIGGNVVNAQPAADTTIALFALDARVRILTNKGEKLKPINELFLGAGKSVVDSTREIVIAFEFKTPGKYEATAFMRHAKRKALALPIVNVSVWVKLNEALSKFRDVRIALGPMAPIPVRATNAEAVFKGAPLKESVIKDAAKALKKEVNPRDSIRGSAFYKKELAKVMLKRAISRAIRELGGEISE